MKKLLIIIILMCVPSLSQANSYHINDVRVDIESEKATEARDKAMTEARRNAFNVLKQRLDMPSGLSTDDRTIATLVDSFEINREKTSNNRYLASVNVKFNQRAVQAYLARNTTMAIADDYYQDSTIDNGNRAFNMNQAGSSMGMGLTNNRFARGSMASTDYVMQVNINNLREWTAIRQNLESIGVVQVNRLNTRMAEILLKFQGEAALLQNELNGRGLKIYHNQPSSNIPYLLMRKG